VCNFLIVDDDKSIRNLLHQNLLRLNFPDSSIYKAVYPDEALALSKKIFFHIVLSDIVFPGSFIDGLEFGKLFKKLNPISITIAMTGYRGEYSYSNCFEYGFDDIIFKPDEVVRGGVFDEVVKASYERMKRRLRV
jgi:CheY-like chemotaxis protein